MYWISNTFVQESYLLCFQKSACELIVKYAAIFNLVLHEWTFQPFQNLIDPCRKYIRADNKHLKLFIIFFTVENFGSFYINNLKGSHCYSVRLVILYHSDLYCKCYEWLIGTKNHLYLNDK